MKAAERRLLAATLLPALLLALCIVLAAALLAATLDAPQRAALWALVEPNGVFVFLAWLIAALPLGWFTRHWYLRHEVAAAQLLEGAQALVAAGDAQQEPLRDVQQRAASSPALDELARLIERLDAEQRRLRSQIAHEVAAASRGIDAERSRLAALMSELAQAVVVCNRDGIVLLYNGRARLAFRALSRSPELTGGAELVGLGRSIYDVFDRALVQHALERIDAQIARGRADPGAQFVTSAPGAQLLRVQTVPVRKSGAASAPQQPGAAAAIDGFVLMIENVTREFEHETQRDRLLLALTEGSRASLANMQAASEMLDFPDLDAPMRERFLRVIRDEIGSMGERIRTLSDATLRNAAMRWPLEDMRGADLVAAAAQRIGALLGQPVELLDVDVQLWLKVDSYSMLLALEYLASRLVDEFDVRRMQLRLGTAAGRAQLDLIWRGQALSTETVMGWQMDPMRIGAQTRSPLSVRDVLERHDAECWFERDRPRELAFFRVLLPLAEARDDESAHARLSAEDSRPEFYDFDLFAATGGGPARELAERPLAELSYTVFDTETTGLNPTQGDEIVQIGAVRVVNGRLLAHDRFDQLIDPRRDIPDASIAVHGITPEMVAGKPTIDAVLPAFHRFAQGSVLVAHNAAFDLRFLQLKQAQAGVRFDAQPVLDTLLLSALAQPQQESHALEAIAERLGIAPPTKRHDALGDAIVTAQVLLRLIALLHERGIVTLGQALDAAKKTWYARLEY